MRTPIIKFNSRTNDVWWAHHSKVSGQHLILIPQYPMFWSYRDVPPVISRALCGLEFPRKEWFVNNKRPVMHTPTKACTQCLGVLTYVQMGGSLDASE